MTVLAYDVRRCDDGNVVAGLFGETSEAAAKQCQDSFCQPFRSDDSR